MAERIAVYIVLVALTCLAVAQQATRGLSLSEAKQLVMAGLPPTQKHLPGFSLEHFPEQDSADFYFFTAAWGNPNPKGSVVAGNYAVDKATADVWNSVMACEELSTPALRELQSQVRSRIGLTPPEYRKRKRGCPLDIGWK
jgi:hypothetical protein